VEDPVEKNTILQAMAALSLNSEGAVQLSTKVGFLLRLLGAEENPGEELIMSLVDVLGFLSAPKEWISRGDDAASQGLPQVGALPLAVRSRCVDRLVELLAPPPLGTTRHPDSIPLDEPEEDSLDEEDCKEVEKLLGKLLATSMNHGESAAGGGGERPDGGPTAAASGLKESSTTTTTTAVSSACIPYAARGGLASLRRGPESPWQKLGGFPNPMIPYRSPPGSIYSLFIAHMSIYGNNH